MDSHRLAAFFTAPTFKQLAAWGQHADNSFALVAEHDADTFVLQHGRFTERERVALKPDFATLAAHSEWPGLE